MPPMASRDEIVLEYIDRLQYPPYPVQEEALFAWAACDGGVLLSAPTGTGKTLVAEAAVYEGLRSGKVVYYSTPLIALTDQKLIELQDTVARWGYDRDHVGLVTGHRTVNPSAQVKVVVAEVLLNRLLHPAEFDFADVGAVVMDEFHNFNDPQRGIVWELALSLLPQTREGDAAVGHRGGRRTSSSNWMARSLERRVTLVEGTERKVPLHVRVGGGRADAGFSGWRIAGPRRPTTAEGRRRWCSVSTEKCAGRRPRCCKGKEVCTARGNGNHCWTGWTRFRLFKVGAGGQVCGRCWRGAWACTTPGLLPRYRRVVEMLFQEKLLPDLRVHRDTGGGAEFAGAVGRALDAGQGASQDKKRS